MNLSTLYIHIPFCHSKCAYCDFFSVPRQKLSEQFVDALCNELSVRVGEWPYRFETAYIGGGTPTSLTDSQLERVIDVIPPDPLREFTIEVNPEDITPERAAWLASTRIDRVSMGIQTFDDAALQLIGRRHDAARAVEAYEELRRAGFGNISCDLIYGLPGQTPDDWRRSLEALIKLRPEHISAYLLSYEEGTRLNAMRLAGKVAECQPEVAEEMYGILCEATRGAGYEHYEISNFALPGRRALHNSRYWDFTPYLGVGPGAHGFDGERRFSVAPDISRYISTRGLGTRIIEEETTDERYNDYVMTSLRTSRGLSPDEVERRFGDDYRRITLRTAGPLLDSGLLVSAPGGRLVIPESRWLTANDTILHFIQA